MGNLLGARDVKNCLDSLERGYGDIRSCNFPHCPSLFFQVIITSKKTADTLAKFTVFFDL